MTQNETKYKDLLGLIEGYRNADFDEPKKYLEAILKEIKKIDGIAAEQKRLILEEVKALPEMQDEQPIHMGIMGSPDRKDFLVALNRNGLRQELRQRLSQLEE